MENIIRKNKNIDICRRHEVTKIIHDKRLFKIHVNQNKVVLCEKCICALPKPALIRLSVFTPIYDMIDKVKCGKLCRIYSHFDPDKEKELLSKIGRFTTDNDLRMVIPYNLKEGTIMISYSDNIFAERWKRLADKGMREVNSKLKKNMLESTGLNIPQPKFTKIFYWGCGVGYWGVGADSEKIAEKMICPFPNMELYICGENYSENGQQWMEGALETSNKVLEKIFS
jgi:monoamine oxidase